MSQATTELEGRTPNRVFVLGAGFTRAFVPRAPLLVDDYNGQLLKERFSGFMRTSQILENEIRRHERGWIDLERLMTRLDGPMPFDATEVEPQLALLLSELKLAFAAKLADAKRLGILREELAQLANYIVRNRVHCITFNYDDVLDQALWEVSREDREAEEPFWHPDGGYGFFCPPSMVCVDAEPRYMDRTTMLLLKLHGSTNWRLRRGAARPYALDALVHDEAWLTLRTDEFPGVANDEVRDLIQRHLEPTPLLVPPVLMKTDLAQQPILRLVWALAFEALSAATRVTFIGYSLPITDIASAAMLGEALGRLDPSKIVVVGRDSARKNELMASYRRVFPELTDDRFRWDGAVAWAAEIAADSPLQAPLILPTG